MIETNAGWISRDSLRLPDVMGRKDSPEMIAKCVHYLELEHPRGVTKEVSEPRPRQVRRAILEARVHKSVSTRTREAEIQTALDEREARLERQAATIDRLLAFVPTKRGAIPGARLGDLARQLAARLRGLTEEIAVSVADEEDPDTSARHRFLVLVPHGATRAEAFAVEAAAGDILGEIASSSEAPALTLSVIAD